MIGPWDEKVDIWMFGCLVSDPHHLLVFPRLLNSLKVYEWVCGKTLFSRSHPKIPTEHFHNMQMIRFLGHPFSIDVIKDYELAKDLVDVETGT